MKPLDPIAVDLEKTTLIEASAGTGKTYTIATLVLRLLAKGYPIESILVVTFTEAAASELKLRIRSRLADMLRRLRMPAGAADDDLIKSFRAPDGEHNGEKQVEYRLSLALADFDQAAVMTIHSFCYKVLREFSFESRSFFDVELAPDRSAFLVQAGYDFFMGHVNDLDPLMLAFLAQEQVTPETFTASFKKVLSRPDLAWVPASAAPQPIFDDYRKAVVRARQILDGDSEDIVRLLADHKGIDKRSYSKKNVPAWIAAVKRQIAGHGDDTLFKMTEKGDPAYKFTYTRLKEKTKQGSPMPVHPFFDCCETLLNLSVQFPDHLIQLKQDFIDFLRRFFEAVKQHQGICFFDDLVNDLAASLEQDPETGLASAVRDTYSACLIDEFQDTDPRQYDIFSTLFSVKGSPFFMIGDPKQAIYAFRGGDIFAYLKAVRNSEQRFTLDKNYRSAPLLVRGVNRLFSLQPDPFVYKDIGFGPVSCPDTAVNRLINNRSGAALPPLQIGFVFRGTHSLDRSGFIPRQAGHSLIPGMVAADMAQLLGSDTSLLQTDGSGRNPVRPGDIAVLVRTNEQAVQVQKALAALRIPSFLSKTGSVFDSAQAVELHDIMQAVHEPGNSPLMRAALCTSVFGFDQQGILALNQDDHAHSGWHDFFHTAKQVWEQKGFVSMIMSLLHSDQAFLKGNDSLDERALTNFYHLIELTSRAGVRSAFSPFHLMKWYETQLCQPLREASDEQELRLESDRNAVAVVTIHKSKGLEYPVVYLPYLWEGQRAAPKNDILYHDPDREYRLTMDLGSTEIEAASAHFEREDRAEQRRLLYVALTRASAMCRIIWGGFASVASSSLSGLLHPDGCKDDDTLQKDLKRLVSGDPEAIQVRHLDPEPDTTLYRDEPDTRSAIAAREVQRQIQPVWKITSFSAMAHSTVPAGIPGPPLPESPRSERGTDTAGEIDTEIFPKGAVAGDFFHAVFEAIDFKGTETDMEQQVEIQLARFGFTDPALKPVAVKCFRSVLDTSLESESGRPILLGRVPKERRLNEMGFTLKVSSLNIPDLRQCLEAHPMLHSIGYADRMAGLDPAVVNGFLKGFIDLVIQEKGRYFILDYKSNYLGPTWDTYAPESMKTAMAEHHYFLQYHIYLLALHRYLELRLDNYDYDTHIGGVYYLFIRGMHPDHGSTYGVFFDRPPKAVIQSLSDKI